MQLKGGRRGLALVPPGSYNYAYTSSHARPASGLCPPPKSSVDKRLPFSCLAVWNAKLLINSASRTHVVEALSRVIVADWAMAPGNYPDKCVVITLGFSAFTTITIKIPGIQEYCCPDSSLLYTYM